jgi:uncharacterized protein (TIGR02246 family)
MKSAFEFFFIIIVFSATCFGQSTDLATIKQLNQQWLNALVKNDSAALANILADDFILINPAGARRTKADNESNLRQPNQEVTSIQIDSEDVRLLSGDVGIITVWTTNNITMGTEKTVLKICYMDIYQKRNNKWKAVAAHVTLLP